MDDSLRPLASNPTIGFRLCVWRNHEIRVVYVGIPADLVAAGIATQEMVAPSKRGKPRLDEDGHRFYREMRAGGKMKLSRELPRDKAMLLPGVADELQRLHVSQRVIDVGALEASVASILSTIAKHSLKETLPIHAENLLRDLEEQIGEFLDQVPFEDGTDGSDPPTRTGPKLRLVGGTESRRAS